MGGLALRDAGGLQPRAERHGQVADFLRVGRRYVHVHELVRAHVALGDFDRTQRPHPAQRTEHHHERRPQRTKQDFHVGNPPSACL